MDFDWEASQCGVAVAWATVLQFSEATSEWVSRVGNAAWPRIEAILDFASNPWARALGLGLIVYFTIRVIASVYSGDKQNSEMGPVGIRPHMGKRLDRHSVMLPHSLMSMTMDGVSANCRVFYVYRDAQGKRRKKEVYRQRNMRLAISPSRLRGSSEAQYGFEIPDVATADVCFPPVDVEKPEAPTPATPERARDYAELHKIIENWTEDDDAPLVSFKEDILEEITDNRRTFIVDSAAEVRKAREAHALIRWLKRSVAKNRPNVVGSYYIQLEFSQSPWFVLTKHPDRDLKMTAWLTVLTSAFALIMDAWPKAPLSDGSAARTTPHESSVRPPRVPAPN
jgi:hypothetical protein